jgi:hypothetical protein
MIASRFRPEAQYGCVRCQTRHFSCHPLFQAHLWHQSRHGISVMLHEHPRPLAVADQPGPGGPRTADAGMPADDRLVRDLLQLVFHAPEVRSGWKDRLSDWIVDLAGEGRRLTASALVERLSMHHPEVLRRLAVHPLVREGLRELLTRTAAR